MSLTDAEYSLIKIVEDSEIVLLDSNIVSLGDRNYGFGDSSITEIIKGYKSNGQELFEGLDFLYTLVNTYGNIHITRGVLGESYYGYDRLNQILRGYKLNFRKFMEKTNNMNKFKRILDKEKIEFIEEFKERYNKVINLFLTRTISPEHSLFYNFRGFVIDSYEQFALEKDFPPTHTGEEILAMGLYQSVRKSKSTNIISNDFRFSKILMYTMKILCNKYVKGDEIKKKLKENPIKIYNKFRSKEFSLYRESDGYLSNGCELDHSEINHYNQLIEEMLA